MTLKSTTFLDCTNSLLIENSLLEFCKWLVAFFYLYSWTFPVQTENELTNLFYFITVLQPIVGIKGKWENKQEKIPDDKLTVLKFTVVLLAFRQSASCNYRGHFSPKKGEWYDFLEQHRSPAPLEIKITSHPEKVINYPIKVVAAFMTVQNNKTRNIWCRAPLLYNYISFFAAVSHSKNKISH